MGNWLITTHEEYYSWCADGVTVIKTVPYQGDMCQECGVGIKIE